MNYYTQKHLTSSIVMVRPHDFGFNQQTGADNEFQHQPLQHQQKDITKQALSEFSSMVDRLEKFYIEVLVLEEKQTIQTLPDAIFPNNWFSTRADGSLFIYPMKTPNRQAEVQVDTLVAKLAEAGYTADSIVDLREEFQAGQVLEGTGSLIFHHPSSKVFAALSERCDSRALELFCSQYGYKALPFESRTQQKKSIYHTNVLMSCGEDFVVIARETLHLPDQQSNLIAELESTVNDLLFISEQQMANHFCGNILQLKDKKGSPCIVMSDNAFKGFTASQLKLLEKHGSLIVCDIRTIEYIGGGSARCMIAENFLPHKTLEIS